MPANRTSASLLLALAETRAERDKLKLECELLRNQLQRYPAGVMQIRAVERTVAALTEADEPLDGS
ncbi:hypothetical protein [Frateuria sp. Soil773]|uniref:hypothetical protein n=1 Tax=Frateuria sp. Soil773 TaxID=1736407 RepID=UPI0012FCC716|nr:hypothetical protein [Frateuria sp. Soil773]